MIRGFCLPQKIILKKVLQRFGCINKDTVSLHHQRNTHNKNITIMTHTHQTRPANANEILNQLGGKRFIMFTGTKQFIDMGDGLKMTLTANKLKAKYLYIQLLSDDTYLMTFAKIVNFEWCVIKQIEGVYCNQLVEIFEKETGLYTKF